MTMGARQESHASASIKGRQIGACPLWTFNLIWEAQGCKDHPYACAGVPGLIERGKISPDSAGSSGNSCGGLENPAVINRWQGDADL